MTKSTGKVRTFFRAVLSRKYVCARKVHVLYYFSGSLVAQKKYGNCTRVQRVSRGSKFKSNIEPEPSATITFQTRDRYPCSARGCTNQAKSDKFCAYGAGDELLKCANKVCGYCASKSMCCDDHTVPCAASDGPKTISLNLVINDPEDTPHRPPMSGDFRINSALSQQTLSDSSLLPFKRWDDRTLECVVDLVIKHQAHLKTSMSMEAKWNAVRLEFYEFRKGFEYLGWQALMRNYNNQCKEIRETFIENDRSNLSAYGEPNAMQNKFVSAIKADSKKYVAHSGMYFFQNFMLS